nr:MAG TPA: hypothetical protein [Bacteriophage sp.]
MHNHYLFSTKLLLKYHNILQYFFVPIFANPK